MHNIEKNLAGVQRRIAAACQRYGREKSTIKLLAVSKKKSLQDIEAAFRGGQRDFGESYLQEAEDKITQLGDHDIRWHFIGPIQSNKTRSIAKLFDWVHSVDRLKIARRLSEARPDDRPPLQLLLQVNIDTDPHKSGIAPADIASLADEVVDLPRLQLRGLMAIPAMHTDFAAQREPFAAMHRLFTTLQRNHPGCDTLSMGMSADLEAAIAEGSTLVRIGTAIFGARAD